MSKQRYDETSLRDILLATGKITEFVEGMSQAEFCDDQKTISAVLYQMAVMGEAVKRLSINLRERYPDVPWSDVAGLRDKLVHDYEEIDYPRIWTITNQSIPALILAVQEVLAAETEAQNNFD
ncbi:MAG: HepT-like ribonuclease domain-containing protein [Cyanobacteria bacterium P01_C01_bin.89]